MHNPFVKKRAVLTAFDIMANPAAVFRALDYTPAKRVNNIGRMARNSPPFPPSKAGRTHNRRQNEEHIAQLMQRLAARGK